MPNAKLSLERMQSQSSLAPTGALEIAVTKLLIEAGFQHKRIAALFDCNQGRIAEIACGNNGGLTGYIFEVRHVGLKVAEIKDTTPAGPRKGAA